MHAVVLTKHGGPDVLELEQREEPSAGWGEVRIQVAAAGVNFADVMARVGLYPDAPKPPYVLGYEVAGTIIEVGDGVHSFADGQRVMAGTRFGGYSEQVVVPESSVVALPDELTFAQGAAIPINYATAWSGLIQHANLQPEERVLIHAAAGGVGIAATQIAREQGAEIYGTASPSKHEAIRAQGVAHAIDYRKPGWEKGLEKFDVIMDAVGGRSFRTSYDLLAPGGRLVAFGASAVVSGERRNLLAAARTALRMPRFNLIKQMSESKSVIGLNMLTLWDARGTLQPWIEPLQELIERGSLKPVVAESFSFDRAGDAHRMIVERRNVGKVVLEP